MIVKDLIEQLKQYDEDAKVWLYHKLKGEIMPKEIVAPIRKTELTADGVLLKG